MLARYEQKDMPHEAHSSVRLYRSLVNLPHWHMEHELIFVKKGRAEVMINNSHFTMEDGMAAVAEGGEVHYIRSEKGSEVAVMKISADYVKSIMGAKGLCQPVLEKTYGISRRFDEMLEELRGGREYGGIIADSIALRLIAEIFREEKVCAKSRSEKNTGEKYKELLRYISEEYAHITFDEAAEYMCLSRPYFSKYFHRISGMTFTKYLNIVRVSAAAEKISEGRLTMTEIAVKCGFGTIRSFNRVFKELTGCSPTELPSDFVYVRLNKADYADKKGFDPTLGETEVIQGTVG